MWIDQQKKFYKHCMNARSSRYIVSNTPVHLQLWISTYNIFSFLLAIDSDQRGFGSLHAVVPDVRDSNSYISSHPCHQQSPRGRRIMDVDSSYATDWLMTWWQSMNLLLGTRVSLEESSWKEPGWQSPALPLTSPHSMVLRTSTLVLSLISSSIALLSSALMSTCWNIWRSTNLSSQVCSVQTSNIYHSSVIFCECCSIAVKS